MTDQQNEIIARLQNHTCHPDTYPNMRRGAVLICFAPEPSGELGVILTLRASTLRTHPNEVCLPGGKADDVDESLIATAFREAEEEIGLLPSQHTYITTLHPFVSAHLLIVTPIVSMMNADADFEPRVNPDEVSDVFTLPLSRFLSSYNHSKQDLSWYGQIWKYHTYGVPHIPDVINEREYPVTGFTAAVLLHCAVIGIGGEVCNLEEFEEAEVEDGKSWEDIFITTIVESGELERRQRRSRRPQRKSSKRSGKRTLRNHKKTENSRI
ncbi:hypothetical protein K450DRAFT_246591 [Umbelopsis ramanniana AG]|uniref:Nudix hydrolase domain-containing protein n=1 Tax=Umbelopsis ramanniana AG TaxID=1314678 RepID=A0AAD5E8C6_UMBRA|nr:uncharacterized protein K450DRAFT_246591 [Umbelopsis ramanniana AG]KAI8578592.1 hypothetical protein K450DRAFT_246591 [Umbelopsis ramanniana AG]